MPLELKFNISDTVATQSFGNIIPAWINDLANAWYFENDNIDYGFSVNGNTVYIQYGNNRPQWASMRFWSESVHILEQTTNEDNSITAKISVTPNFWKSRRITTNAGFRVNYSIKVNNVEVWNYSGTTIDNIEKGQAPSQIFTVTIPPEKHSSAAAFNISVEYPDGEFSNNSFFVGFYMYNTNPATIKPWAIRKSNVFKTLNRASGIFQKRSSNVWQNVSQQPTDSVNQINKGNHRIRKSSTWKGQGKIGID